MENINAISVVKYDDVGAIVVSNLELQENNYEAALNHKPAECSVITKHFYG